MQSRIQDRSGRRAAWIFGTGILLLLILTILGIEISLRRPVDSGWTPDHPSEKSFPEGHALFPREIVDAMGRRHLIQDPPQRIVSQTLGTDEILLSICSPQRLAAVSALANNRDYSNVAGAVSEFSLTQVEGVEQILRLDPDLIFVASYSRAEMVDLLGAAGAPVFVFASFNRIDDIKSNIRTVGKAIGEDARAEEQIKQMERRIDHAKGKIPAGTTPPRVMSFTTPGFTAGADTLFDDIIRTVGAINVAVEKGVVGIQQIDVEQIVVWKPDFIISGAGSDARDTVREQLLANPVIAASQASRNGRIIIVDNRHLMAVSHHIAGAVEAIVHGLYDTGTVDIR